MNVNVTAGSGTIVATVIKDASSNYQRVITHRTRNRVTTVVATAHTTYANGTALGGETDLNGVFRSSAEPGLTNTAELDSIQLRMAPGQATFEVDVFILAEALQTTPADAAAPAMAGSENLNAVQQLVQFNLDDWLPGLAGDYVAVKAPASRMIFAGPSETQLRLVLVARNGAVLSVSQPLSVAVNVAQD